MQITFNKPYPAFPAERLDVIGKELADTATGLTSSQIDHLLRNSDIPNPTPEMTKWKRPLKLQTASYQVYVVIRKGDDGPHSGTYKLCFRQVTDE